MKKCSTYNNPIIPEGFHKTETKEASWKLENGIPKGWNDGLVIEDNIGNQFVWVPVNLDEYRNNIPLINSNLIFNENNMEADRDYDYQVIRYGGFYVSRYEAGRKNFTDPYSINANVNHERKINLPYSKKGLPIWNMISWDFAKASAQSMYMSPSLKSDLISPKEWCTMCEWIRKKGYNMVDSSSWGNYENSSFTFSGLYLTSSNITNNEYKNATNMLKPAGQQILLSTGASERNKACNIYDLAGNGKEYTDKHAIYKFLDEKNLEDRYQNRNSYGGSFAMTSEYSAGSSTGISEDKMLYGQTFRIVLYQP